MSPEEIEGRQRTQSSGVAATMIATLVFSWGGVVVKGVGLPAATLAAYRLAIGALFIAAVALWRRTPWPRSRGPLFGAGLIFGVHQLLFVAATQQTSIAIVTLFAATQPLLVAAASRRTVGERTSPALVGYSLLAVLGVAIVIHANLGDRSRSLQGDLCAAANVLLFTVYFLSAKRAVLAGASPLTFTGGFFAIALLVVAPAALLTAPALPDSRQSLLLLVLALGPGNGHLLLNWAHPRISAALASLILAGMPMLATVWAHLVFGEPLGWRHAIGILLVAGAVEGGRRSERHR